MGDSRPFMIYAAVAPKGHNSYCFHKVMLCALEVPTGTDGKVRCKRRIHLHFDRADRISEQHRAAGRLANAHQKNWAPFVFDSHLYLVFTIEPLVVVRVDINSGKCIEVSEARTPAMQVFHNGASASPDEHSTLGVHGGSPLIPLPGLREDELLGIGRIARGNTQYALFLFTLTRGAPSPEREFGRSLNFNIARVSPIFCFASTSPHHRGL